MLSCSSTVTLAYHLLDQMNGYSYINKLCLTIRTSAVQHLNEVKFLPVVLFTAT